MYRSPKRDVCCITSYAVLLLLLLLLLPPSAPSPLFNWIFLCFGSCVCVCFFCVLLVWTSSPMMRCSFDGKVFHFDMILCIIQSKFLAQILLIFSCVRKSFQVNWFKCFILFAVPAKWKYVCGAIRWKVSLKVSLWSLNAIVAMSGVRNLHRNMVQLF